MPKEIKGNKQEETGQKPTRDMEVFDAIVQEVEKVITPNPEDTEDKKEKKN